MDFNYSNYFNFYEAIDNIGNIFITAYEFAYTIGFEDIFKALSNETKELLDNIYNMKENNNIYFAGQITGVEGYVESISSRNASTA